MALFKDALPVVLQHEGGYAWNSADPGGETKWGISKRAHPQLDIKNLTLEQASNIYREEYWLPIYEEIVSQEVGTKVFDMAVNMGHARAHKLLQQALSAQLAGPVAVDGKFGPQTLKFVNACVPEDLMRELRARCADFYCRLVLDDPNKKQFLFGWLRRACS